MLGIAIANLINIFNFPLYLLSGGVVAGWDQFAPAMMDESREAFLHLSQHENAHRKGDPW